MKNTYLRYSGVALLAAFTATPALADTPYNAPQKVILRAATSSPQALQQALSSGLNINSTDDDRETALMEAAEDGNLKAVENLIAAGADVNLCNEDAENALMLAAEDGHTAIVKELIKAGANVNAVDEEGETALRKAVEDGYSATAEVIRQASGK